MPPPPTERATLRICHECAERAVRNGRCHTHDEAYRLARYGLCQACNRRAVWSKGLCPSCEKRAWRAAQLRREFTGSGGNRDDYLRLVDALIARVVAGRAAYVLYLDTGEGGRSPVVIATGAALGMLHAGLKPRAYAYAMRRVNDGLSARHRIPTQKERP